ncbi:unnamed protein product [Penicillium salamii]|nr:unnamed protein product [Penicillium salamii]CAG8278593.1 unnamed protein product [Penicillium salamii]
MHRSSLHLGDQRGRRAREDQPTVIGVGEEGELGRRRAVWLRVAPVPRRLARGQGNLPRGNLFPHRPADHGRRLGRWMGPAPASFQRGSATRGAGARPPALGRLARRPVAAARRVTAQEAQGAFFPPVLTEGIGHLVRVGPPRALLPGRRRHLPPQALDDHGPVPSADRVVVMFIRGRGEVGEEEQGPPAPELVRQAHVPAPGAQPLGEAGGQRRLDPGRDQLRLDQKATDLGRVADARDLVVDEFHEEAQQQPRADVVDRDLGVETVQQANDRVQHGPRGARGRGLCDRVEEGVGVGGPVPDDRLRLGAEVSGAPVGAQLVDQPVLALATAGRGLLRRAGVPVVAQAIELVQLGRELFGPVSICEPPLRERVSACPRASPHTSSSSLSFSTSSWWSSMVAKVRMLSQISTKAMVLLGGRREEEEEEEEEEGKEIRSTVERMMGMIYTMADALAVTWRTRPDRATFLDSGRMRSTRAKTLDTSLVVGDLTPTRAPPKAVPTFTGAQLRGRPGPASMSAAVGASEHMKISHNTVPFTVSAPVT